MANRATGDRLEAVNPPGDLSGLKTREFAPGVNLGPPMSWGEGPEEVFGAFDGVKEALLGVDGEVVGSGAVSEFFLSFLKDRKDHWEGLLAEILEETTSAMIDQEGIIEAGSGLFAVEKLHQGLDDLIFVGAFDAEEVREKGLLGGIIDPAVVDDRGLAEVSLQAGGTSVVDHAGAGKKPGADRTFVEYMDVGDALKDPIIEAGVF